MNNIIAKTLERIYIDRFNEIKGHRIKIEEDSKIIPVIDTG